MNPAFAEVRSSRELAGIMPCQNAPPKRVASPLETHVDDPLDGCVLELNIRNNGMHPFLKIEQWEPFPGLGDDGDWEEKSVRSSRSTRSWWNRRRRIGSQQKASARTKGSPPTEVRPRERNSKTNSNRSVESLRIWGRKSKRKNKRASGATTPKRIEQKNSSQLVLEFFDLEPMESESVPEQQHQQVSPRNLRRRASMDHHHMMEGRTSMQSTKTMSTTTNISAFLRKFTCIKFSKNEKTVEDDEDITLASGLGRVTPATEDNDEYTVGSALTPLDSSTTSRERSGNTAVRRDVGGEEAVLRENKRLLRQLLMRRRRSGTIIISGEMMREVLGSKSATTESDRCETISEMMDTSTVSQSENGSIPKSAMRSIDGVSDLSSNSSRGRYADRSRKTRAAGNNDPEAARNAMRNCFSKSYSVNSGSWEGETEPETVSSSTGDDEFVGSIGDTARDSNSGAHEDEYESNPCADETSLSQTSMLSGLLATWAAEKDAIRRGTKRARAKVLKRLYPYGMAPDVPKKSAIKASDTADKPARRAVFDRVEIRAYDRTLGDNPSCVAGPPLTIDWTFVVVYESAIDQFESLRPKRRSKREFHLSPNARTLLLMRDWNVTEQEIRKARQEASSFQTSRQAIASSRSAAMAAGATIASSKSAPVINRKKSESDTDSQPGFFRRVGRRNSLDIYVPPSARVSSGHMLYEPATRACI